VLPSSRRTEGIGYYGLSNNLAMAIAPTIGIFIYQFTHSFEFLFWLALIVATIGWLIDSTVVLKPRVASKASQSRTSRPTRLSLDRFFLTRAWLMAINIAMFGFGFGTLSNFLAIYSKQELGITGGTGTYFMLLSMGLFLSRIQGGKALHKGLITHNASEGMLISLVGYFLFVAWIHPVGYYLSAILIGLGNGHLYPAFLNMFIKIARHDERGTANSSILTGWDCGFGLGILIGGIAAEFWGYLAAFWIVFGVNISGVLLYFIKTKQFYLTRRLED
jgi:predicted MFS family arabinose efflux permease